VLAKENKVDGPTAGVGLLLPSVLAILLFCLYLSASKKIKPLKDDVARALRTIILVAPPFRMAAAPDFVFLSKVYFYFSVLHLFVGISGVGLAVYMFRCYPS